MNSGCILKVELIKSTDGLDVGVGEREWDDNKSFGSLKKKDINKKQQQVKKFGVRWLSSWQGKQSSKPPSSSPEQLEACTHLRGLGTV